MLYLNASSSENQPCDAFGLHKNLESWKDIYDNGDGIFFANTGHLSKPVTPTNWDQTKGQLFSHFHMMQEIQSSDPFFQRQGTGVLGRMLDVLKDNNYATEAPNAGRVNSGKKVRPFSLGMDKFYPQGPSNDVDKSKMKQAFENLNNQTHAYSGIFGNHWSSNFIESQYKSSRYHEAIKDVSLNYDMSGLSDLGMIAKAIKAHQTRKVSRDAFSVLMEDLMIIS